MNCQRGELNQVLQLSDATGGDTGMCEVQTSQRFAVRNQTE
eukprot:CAMPEP_0114306556 /NCGR_PEP_ID=MMETSP0059-20121206/16969_1 /TAXON_ID=36894 /ORGANISM="Pyramimonas parkeae, Strain CCMP726" /LENGTH=40 /DNA_ID= /DNA_START= /DNA_END= /DNA_ORIENTATION=